MKLEFRYLVGDKALASYHAALAYAGDLCARGPDTVYVRELGKQGSVAVVERDSAGVVHIKGRLT